MTSRVGSDRCPGALSLHEAADGLLARVRLPGGFIDAETLRGISEVAAKFGDERLELTSRGNLQIRGIRAECQAKLADDIAALGLLPSPSHERVRNIVASSLAGLDNRGSGNDLQGIVTKLDGLICSTLRLAELSGRFLFGIDDGRGDIDALGPDIRATATGENWLIYPGDFTVAADDVPAVLAAVAEVFLDVRAEHDSESDSASLWRMNDLADLVVDLEGRTVAIAKARGWLIGAELMTTDRPIFSGSPPVAGVIGRNDEEASSVIVQVPLGRLSAAQAQAIANVLGGQVARVTPWRSIVIPGCGDGQNLRTALESTGLVIDATAVWNNLTACAGRPGCAKALADVQTDATQAAKQGSRLPLRKQRPEKEPPKEQATPLGPLDGDTVSEGAGQMIPQMPVHWSGCERRCGRPATSFVDVLATEDGYTVTRPTLLAI